MKREVIYFTSVKNITPELDKTLCGRLIHFKGTTEKPYHVSCRTCRHIISKLNKNDSMMNMGWWK